jgi:hypothetical protein
VEGAYQLCGGFVVNTGYFSIHPNVGGTFDKITEGHDAKKHPVTFRFRTRAPLRALAERIVVESDTRYIGNFRLNALCGSVNVEKSFWDKLMEDRFHIVCYRGDELANDIKVYQFMKIL